MRQLQEIVEIKPSEHKGSGLYAKVDIEPYQLQLGYWGEHYEGRADFEARAADKDTAYVMQG
eukprot:COSAG02_NODE_381_length_23450_cov_65.782493_20_plen_62_part_00